VDICGVFRPMTRNQAVVAHEKNTITHRGHELLNVLQRLGGSARNAQISQVMGVSEETVRRLVKMLDKAGRVERVHGGTYLRGNDEAPVFSGSLGQNPKEKSRIANAVADMVSDDMTLFLNVGSTTTYVAEQLRLRRNLMVVTNSISVTQALANHNDNRVFLAGGEVEPSERGTFGSETEAYVRQFTYDLAIFGANAISSEFGFMVMNPAEAGLTRVASGQAEKVVFAAGSTKFGARAPVVVCPPETVTHLVTDAPPDEKLAAVLAKWGVEVRIANEKVEQP